MSGSARRAIRAPARRFRALLASAVLAVLPAVAEAQMPPGSYLRACRDARLDRGILVAVCRKLDGRMQPAALGDAANCVGDIANSDGELNCNRAAGPPARPPYNPIEEHRAECARVDAAVMATRQHLAQNPPGDERARLDARLAELARERAGCPR
jgi:hypothetical protein